MELDIREMETKRLPPTDMAAQIQKLEEELIVERDRNLRTLADFKNYRRRIDRDSAKAADEGKRAIMISLLDIVDDLEKAMQWAGNEEQPFAQGVRNIHKKFISMLESQGIQSFVSVGTAFDHNLHEAVVMAKHNGHVPGTILDELRRGYLWNKELLRHAQVRVAE
jgi:molecular chaperone GrpE